MKMQMYETKEKTGISEKEPKVSLMVPCYNEEKRLGSFLSSLLEQNYSDVELIFINDGSTDQSELIFQEYEAELKQKWQIKYLKQSNQGQAAAINLALKHVSGEFLMWADADDILMSGAIRDKAEFLQAHPEFGMVRNDFYYCFVEGKQESLKPGYTCMEQKQENIFRGLFESSIPCIAGTYMMRTKLFDCCYPDRQIPLSPEGQNFQMLLPPASRSKCGFIDRPLLKYRQYSDSHSNKKRTLTEQLARLREFRRLQKELLTYCACDKEEYMHLADALFEKQQHNIAKILADTMRQTQ